MGTRSNLWNRARRLVQFIFHNSSLLEFSPVVTVWWHGKVEVIDLLNRLPADSWALGLTSQQ